MGIVRYPVQCPGCDSGIVLRLGVGLDPHQPFFYVCGKCRAATRGTLEWSGGAQTSLSLDAGKCLDSEDGCTQTISINPEYPGIADAKDLGDRGGSAFLFHCQILGNEQVAAFQTAAGELHGRVVVNWASLSRLTTYYTNRDWTHFDREVDSLLPSSECDFREPWRRDHALHFLYDLLLVPMWALSPRRHYPEMKVVFNALWDTARPNFSAVVAFAKAEAESPLLARLQGDLFSNLSRYIALRSGLLPGALLDMWPESARKKAFPIRLFRDEFEVLRDLYIQSYEACDRTLRYVVGVANADAHGDAERFELPIKAPGATAKDAKLKTPKNLNAFDKLRSVEKRSWLVEMIPNWQPHWDATLDRQLRNDIGHAAIRHDLPSGNLLRDRGDPIAYVEFVRLVHRIIHPLVASLNALKILRVYAAVENGVVPSLGGPTRR